MKKVLHIIPGWEETCRRKPYKELARLAKNKGYEVVCHKVDWHLPLSPQVFAVGKDDIVFGFSLGAILAWLVSQKHECRHLILASMTPHYSFKDKKIKKLLIDLTGPRFTNDIIKYLKSVHRAKKQTIIYGDMEEEKADILVRNTNHELNSRYLSEIGKLF